MRQFLIGIAVAVALFLSWLGWDGWFYLQRGYSLRVSMSGHQASVFHIGLSAWRGVVHILLWLAAMAVIVAYITGRQGASTAAWLIFAAASLIGIYDIIQYGSIGSPTSIWTVLLLLLVALFTKLGPLTPRRTLSPQSTRIRYPGRGRQRPASASLAGAGTTRC